MTYYAVCWAHGLISHRLSATTAPQAVAEFRATTPRTRRSWIDTAATDLDDDTDTDLSSIATDVLALLDAVVVYSPDRVEGSWQIWSIES